MSECGVVPLSTFLSWLYNEPSRKIFAKSVARYNAHVLNLPWRMCAITHNGYFRQLKSTQEVERVQYQILSVVNKASQNTTGIGVLRADGYNVPVNPLISTTGIASILFAPFGAHGINLSAITAAICTGKEANADSDKRYIAGIACGIFYILFGMFGATIVSLFTVFPAELIVVITGLALFGSIVSSLSSSMNENIQKESTLITFLFTVSGTSIAGIGLRFGD
jgi:hypothetical protein